MLFGWNEARVSEILLPQQIILFCQPYSKCSLRVNQHRYDPYEPTTKSQHCNKVRTASEHSKLDNAERVTAHGPRKHAHDSMAYQTPRC